MSRAARPRRPAYRTEYDTLGPLQVPADALWGAQTQRATENFPVSGRAMPRGFIRALGLIKAAAADANAALGLLERDTAEAIVVAAIEVADGAHDAQFPVDVFQTGSGTSSNMNANEVIAHLAARVLGRAVHPNDHVNCSQSSNDVVPSAIHLSAALAIHESLLPSLRHLASTIERKSRGLRRATKTGRTHLMDAMPLRFEQELSGWAQQIRHAVARIESVQPRLQRLALGGTAVGTGINAHPRFAARSCAALSRRTRLRLAPAENYFEALASQDTAAELSGQLKVAACALMKIANDLRWMNSGPLAGLGEIELPALQPGSSIMPGKVNPVIPESACMAAAAVIGNDAAITVAAQSGNFQLNVMLPLVADRLLDSLQLLTSSARLLADRAIAGFKVRSARIGEALARNPVLITAANPVIGYERGAAIAKQAYGEGRPVLDVAVEVTGLPRAELARLLDPAALTQGGLPGRAKT
ncbi:class II fumarate hydratase [Sinimarinibacterium flocculans]|uniref:class II fumarate hydratase n=1 Tax=Sinimarinibacterium flocculans TaxID=985250 RepID=UPI0024931E3B|nr:class II fumarate hydratase [Sinimarinibacterium flocculans]